MGRRLIGILILLATASVAGIIATQIYWLDKAFEVKQAQIDLRKEQEIAEAKRFNDRVVIALTNVANEILTINNDPAELFQAVKQVQPNFFTVAINDTLHPYLLESLLSSEFERRNISENFEYGIYDCFTDSIVYGDYVALADSVEREVPKGPETPAPEIKWEKDGHYFSVFFPDREPYVFADTRAPVSTWAFSAVIIFIVFLFFAYAVYLVVRQKRLAEMKTDFINNMTHELKTPISTISLSSELLMKESVARDTKRVDQYARLIKAEVLRLKTQVEKVLQLATMDKNGSDLKPERLDMHALVRKMVESAETVAPPGTLEITLDLRADDHYVHADPVHMENILHNLMDNAIKYSGEKPVVKWSTWNTPGKIHVEVRDRGMGIAEKNLPYIFDKFYRVPTGNVHDVKGFGLGLYYVKQLVNEHKGRLDVESRVGRGTAFRMEFPTIKPKES